jgi:hypothetical protein
METLFRALFICCGLLTIATAVVADIYKYRDENGRLSFVDDESKVPEQFRDDVTSVT